MKTSLEWLRNYIDIKWNADELAEMLTLAGLEVEGIERAGEIPETVVAGEILSREKHPNADRLSVCLVNVGDDEPLQIVCGAPNCDPGGKVPVALPGTELGGGFKIKKSKLRGVESVGMMCSGTELGVSQDSEGLLMLPPEAVAGRPVGHYLGTDTVIDWEVTPNRPDWLCHLGIARELAAVAGQPDKLRFPQPRLQPSDHSDIADWAVIQVADPRLCPRYTARVLRGITIGPSPQWMQKALAAVGIRPINNVVDITNYVMMECGQPLHAFDYDKLAEHKVIVRPAADGETIMALDGQTYSLTPDNLLIADANGGIALAGVMGGRNSEIDNSTTTVLLESAAFNPANIRATARRLGLHTESSYRFERGVDLENVEFASRRAAALLQKHAGAELIDGCLDGYPSPYQPTLVPCRVNRVNQLLGLELEAEQIADYFRRLGLTVAEQTSQLISVGIPSFRLDLHREADLIEEVVRLYGLGNIPTVAPVAVVGGSQADDAYFPIEEARQAFLALGLTETMTYSTISVADSLQAIGGGEEQLIKLANPISAEGACMRPSLLPGMLRTVAHNIAHHNHELAVFEIGRVVVHSADYPEERYQAGLALSGLVHPERYAGERALEYDFFDMKGLLEGWCLSRWLPQPEARSAQHPALQPGRCAELLVAGQVLAVFGEVRPELVKGLRLTHPLYLALVELDREVAIPRAPAKARPLPQFPATARDISMIVPRSIQHRDIVRTIQQCPCSWLQDIRLFDVYEDEQVLGADRRSLAYSLIYRDQQRTLTDDEVTQVHEKIKTFLAEKLAVEFR